ncbi:MAG: hypothetical protein K1W35_12935 [Lachnospiraceae bacterium]
MEIEEFMQRAVLEIKKNFGDNLPIETNITKGLHEITILGQSIYVDVFYEIYIKTDDLDKVINDIIEAIRSNLTQKEKLIELTRFTELVINKIK